MKVSGHKLITSTSVHARQFGLSNSSQIIRVHIQNNIQLKFDVLEGYYT
jgi:hypothetical protein